MGEPSPGDIITSRLASSENGSGEARFEEKVLSEQVRTLYSNHRVIYFNVVNATLVAFLVHSFCPTWAVVLWLTLMTTAAALRVWDVRRYRREPGPDERASRWAKRFAAGATATGCVWGLTASVILLTPDPAYHAFIAFVLGGMIAGSITGTSAYLPAVFGFAVPAILPAMVAFFSRGSMMPATMGFMLAAFTTVVLMMGVRANRWIADLARKRIAEAALTADLESQIAERKRAESELVKSNDIVRAVATSAYEILRSFDIDRSIPKVLELIGQSMGVRRIQLYECAPVPSGSSPGVRTQAWIAPAAGPASGWPANENMAFQLPALADEDGRLCFSCEEADRIRLIVGSNGANSLVVVPIFVDGKRWGGVEVESAETAHNWSEVELDTFRTLAEMIGTAVTHARNLKQVADAGRILENSSTILYRLDRTPPYRVTYMSRNAERYGYATSQFLSSPVTFPELFDLDDRPSVVAGIAQVIGKGREITREFRLRNAAGASIWVENHMLPVRRDGQQLAALEGFLIDIHSRKTAQIETVRLTHTDLLTGLPNRTAFMERLADAFAHARHRAQHFAMLYLDLDRFKDVNETLGHPAGDELLRAVAARLKENLRKGDFLARLGGDEFAVLVDGKGGRPAIAAAADGMLSALVPPHPLAGGAFHISASAGVSIYRPDMKKPEEMMREADLALYDAKEHGGDQYIFHTEAHDLAVRERVTLIEEIRAALDRGEFEVYYQPQVEVPSGRIMGLEALLRWNHPKRGLVSPAIFIPVAEKAGSIIPLGRWVLSDVCRQIRCWRNEGIIAPCAAVNVSGAQLFSPSEFERYLMEELLTGGIEPEMLEIELTESVLIDAGRGHTGMLARMRALGLRIAIDDFGTGYSSLAYLRDYPVNRIKIAQQFITGLPEDAGSAAIVRATIGLAREFGIEIIAEGVENANQLDFLVKAGCTSIQGYYFSRPMPADKIAPLLCQGVLEPQTGRDGQVSAAAQKPAA